MTGGEVSMLDYTTTVRAMQWHHGDEVSWVKEQKDTSGFYGMYHEIESISYLLVVPDGDWIVEFNGKRQTISDVDFRKMPFLGRKPGDS